MLSLIIHNIPVSPPKPGLTKSTSGPLQGDIIAGAKQLVNDFYDCTYNFVERNHLPEKIQKFIFAIKPILQPTDEDAMNVFACLEFIYLCLTKLHFHVNCPCSEFSGRPHCYYDHLFELFKIVRLTSRIPRLLSGDIDDPSNILFSFDYSDNNGRILTSMALTLVPWIFTKDKILGDLAQKRFLNYLIRFNNPTELQQDANPNVASLAKTAKPLYFRYVAREILGDPARTRGYSLFYIENIKKILVLDYGDFRGSYCQDIDVVCCSQDIKDGAIHAYPAGDRPIISMRFADCRLTTWINCNFRNIDVKHSDFSGSFLQSLTNCDNSWQHISYKNPSKKLPNFCCLMN